MHGDIWTAAEWPTGWQVRHLNQTGSTNTDLLDDLDAGLVGDRAVLVTDHQTAGRGRLDRRWDAPAGTNLLVSIAVSPVPAVPSQATHRVGLAALFAARSVRSDAVLSLKWPNDLVVGSEKLGGVLVSQFIAHGETYRVAGLGLNLSWVAAKPVDRPVTDLQTLLEQAVARERVLDCILNSVAQGIQGKEDEGLLDAALQELRAG